MARSQNRIKTVQITLSTTPIVKIYLEALVKQGLYGKNAADAAERLLAAKLEEIIGKDAIAANLSQALQLALQGQIEGEMKS